MEKSKLVKLGDSGRVTINGVVLLFLFLIVELNVNKVNGTLSVVSELTNETVFSTEETGVDITSAYGLEGRLVLANPIDACGTISPPPMDSTLPNPHKWILIATAHPNEDSCSTAKKAKTAQFAGYSGIILRHIGSNDTDGVIPRFIDFDWIGVKIYACVVGDDVGAFLIQKYTYPYRYYIKFENEPYYPIGLLANFVIIGFLGIVTVLLLLKLFHYLYFSVSTRVEQRRRRRRTLLSVGQLRKIPIIKWTSSIPQDTCSICIELFEEDEGIRVLPCSHVFHKECIDPWLIKESRKCPNCKRRILFPNEHFSYSSDSGNSDSGDERTPLLRPREDVRFVEYILESHNTRALSQPQNQYLQDPGTSNSSSSTPKPKNPLPKVTFAPTSSTTGSSSGGGYNGTVSTSNAFVLPRPYGSVRSSGGQRKPKLIIANQRLPPNPGGVVVAPSPIVPNNVEEDLTGSSSESERTLVEVHDLGQVQNDESVNDRNREENSLTESTESKAMSFHSCHGFDDSDRSGGGSGSGSSQELFHSFSSSQNV